MLLRILGLGLLILFASLVAAAGVHQNNPMPPAPGAAAVAEPHPETQLLTALDDLDAGRMDQASRSLEQLVKRQPNFRLAQLFYSELLAARAGESSGRRDSALADPELTNLREETRLRLNHWRQSIPAGATPDAILQLSPLYRHAVLVDLPRARLYLLENGRENGPDGSLRVIGSYYASIGKNGIGKQTTGDNRTPLGVYAITGFISDATLPELYGAGAFPVNYPNNWDRRQRRTGSGIWLHGVPRETFNRAPRSSEGCVTLANEDLLALQPHFVPGQTPVVFSDSLTWLAPAERARQRDDFLAQLEGWRKRWSARDTDSYLAYYAPDFETDGMKLRAFSEHKRRVNAGKSFIEVTLSDVDLFRYPGEETLMLARFTQDYRSDNYRISTRKEQYWRREADGRWRIVKEASGK